MARAFHGHYQCSVGEFIRQSRIESACKAILLGDLPLSEIALASGFADLAHFSRTFRRIVGMTPGLVKSNDTPDNQTILPGMEVIEINGYQVTDLLHRFFRIDSADGDIETIKWVHIQRGFSMYYWFLVEQTGEFVVKARDGTGATVVAKLTGVSRNEFGKSQNPVNATMQAGLAKLDWPGENLSLRFLKDPDVAQIRSARVTPTRGKGRGQPSKIKICLWGGR